MTPAGQPEDAADSDFERLLDEFLSAEAAGRPLDVDEWLARAGSHASELREFLANHARMRDLAGQDPLGVPPRGDDGETIVLPSAVENGSGRGLGFSGELEGIRRSSSAPIGEFGGYELRAEIARGGMGVVYRALDRKLNRVVALKMILAGEFASREDVERFRKEATAAAQLDHPGIVHVYEVGEAAGRQFFTMALVEGRSLAERIAAGPLTPRQAAAVTLRITEAIAYAHGKGIVHRDLKPANVLLAKLESGAGGDAARWTKAWSEIGGEPKVTDFGLAKRVEDERGLTMTGQVVGTPSYMSPEQAAGKSSDVGPCSDIYSLGTILYELLTGRPPFRAATPLDTLMQVLEAQPAPPRMVNSAVDRDLQTICLKCLEKAPTARYATAQALADDLRRYLDGETIEAKSQHLLSLMTQAIGRRRHEEVFEGWGRAVTLLGLIVWVAHLAMFGLESWGYGPGVAYWMPRLVMFVLLAANIAYHRPQSLLPINAAERLIWALWIGFFLALGTGNLVLTSAGMSLDLSFALSSVVGGLCFFVMGVHVWGGCYLIGFAFWIMAPLLALAPQYASLSYGTMWAIAFILLGAHYWSRRRPDDVGAAPTEHG